MIFWSFSFSPYVIIRNSGARLFHNVLLSANPKMIVISYDAFGSKSDRAVLLGAIQASRDLNIPVFNVQSRPKVAWKEEGDWQHHVIEAMIERKVCCISYF